MTTLRSPLDTLEPQLRVLLPADLYVTAWLDPSPENLMQVFEHLRTLHRILLDYMPRHVTESQLAPGEVRYSWQSSALMFTDLAGFTPLLEANAIYGTAGAQNLLETLNGYFGTMLEIISKSGGYLLEFTGDALLVEFPDNRHQSSIEQAVRAGIRMQHAMSEFANIQTPQGNLSLGMRIGVHHGRYMMAHIGTPRRMEQILLGTTVRETKIAEGAGVVGRICLTRTAFEALDDAFEVESGDDDDHVLVVDNLTEEHLGDYELTAFNTRRVPSALVLDRSVEGLTSTITDSVGQVEPLACYLPLPILNFLVENAASRRVAPAFLDLTVMFVTVKGLSERVDDASADQERGLVSTFCHAFALINAAVEARGGVLKHVTYHLDGADMLIYFGMPNAHADDAHRAAHTALAIREIVTEIASPIMPNEQLVTRVGVSHGPVFAAEVGEQRGRREWNVLGDTVNTAARLMSAAEDNHILVTESVYHNIWQQFECDPLPRLHLKGKSRGIPVFDLTGLVDE